MWCPIRRCAHLAADGVLGLLCLLQAWDLIEHADGDAVGGDQDARTFGVFNASLVVRRKHVDVLGPHCSPEQELSTPLVDGYCCGCQDQSSPTDICGCHNAHLGVPTA